MIIAREWTFSVLQSSLRDRWTLELDHVLSHYRNTVNGGAAMRFREWLGEGFCEEAHRRYDLLRRGSCVNTFFRSVFHCPQSI